MEQLSLFENECYSDTRPMRLLNTSKDKYLDNATLEVINQYFAVEAMDFYLDPEDEDYEEYLSLYDKVKSILSTWDFYKYHRDMSIEEITNVFITFSASIMNSCYFYVEDDEDNDYEENEEFIDFINRIDHIVRKHYESLLNEWFEGKKLNPVVKPRVRQIVKYNGQFYEIWKNDKLTKSYWLGNKSTWRKVIFIEDAKKLKVYSKRRYYFLRLFSKALFSALKDFFKQGAESFNKEIKRV